ncbi:hypothetical protein [uncultured Methanospirillum sp.]|nr:hypothetical protein [uncultured Methanospirillum sp.]
MTLSTPEIYREIVSIMDHCIRSYSEENSDKKRHTKQVSGSEQVR